MRAWKPGTVGVAGLMAAGLLGGAAPLRTLDAPVRLTAQRPRPPRPPDPLEEFEKQRRRQQQQARREKRQRERIARAERREALEQLQEDLPRLRQNLEAMEKKLAELNPEQELSLKLRQKGEELEELAKRIHKNVKRL